MNLDKKQKITIFGHDYDYDYISSDTVNDILEESFDRAVFTSEPDIACILEILDNLSKAWSDEEYHIRKKAKELLLEITSFSSEMIDEGINIISSICSANRLIKKINFELGSLDYLSDVNNKSEVMGNRIKARPKGVVLHINSGNLFFEIINTWVSGIITKNVNIIKINSELLPFIKLFLDSIKEFDISGIVWTNQAVLSWNDYDDSINDAFFNKDLTLVFQGNKEILDYYKSRFNSNIRLIDNSLKYSFSIVEGKCLKPNIPSELINGLALDLCRWNQKSAYSPHVVYVIDKDLKTSHQLIEALFDEMLAVGEDFSLGNLNFDEKVEIRKTREISRMMQVKGEGRLVCPEDFSFTLILDYNPAFKLSCLNRTLYIKRVTNMENLAEELMPLVNNIQSVGLALSDDTKFIFEKELMKLGVKYFSKIGNMADFNDMIPQNGLFLIREFSDLIYLEE